MHWHWLTCSLAPVLFPLLEMMNFPRDVCRGELCKATSLTSKLLYGNRQLPIRNPRLAAIARSRVPQVTVNNAGRLGLMKVPVESSRTAHSKMMTVMAMMAVTGPYTRKQYHV
jgi:hypothetical protein